MLGTQRIRLSSLCMAKEEECVKFFIDLGHIFPRYKVESIAGREGVSMLRHFPVDCKNKVHHRASQENKSSSSTPESVTLRLVVVTIIKFAKRTRSYLCSARPPRRTGILERPQSARLKAGATKMRRFQALAEPIQLAKVAGRRSRDSTIARLNCPGPFLSFVSDRARS